MVRLPGLDLSFPRTLDKNRVELLYEPLGHFPQHRDRPTRTNLTSDGRTFDIRWWDPCDDGDLEFLTARIDGSGNGLDPEADRRAIQHIEETTTRHGRLASRQRTAWPVTDQLSVGRA